ncbi:hypothetical protein RB25_18100 [Herbaspirillum rubrisubalbicans]|uniref:UDP-N-acetylmuramate--alanine ligase n=1 Tax=Herbaspirillum rubrisubalbicans TaxID=80842 RepID=A0ABX9C226_9BURK|nr:hypothetical protein [Herbaspirillum rubrisubalbicans]RAM64341.1 hypothetical protein RB24_12055 [Herbaspirillum rubrisubalbicans]RAN45672.1 hypothetical protein RB25_18100 [Herbaspirillum rubrisubalbicans]
MSPMSEFEFTSPTEQLRAEIAAAAARMIAEDGADYGTAKRKAAKQILGNQKVRGEIMPDNEQIEDEVRIYHELFFADTQPARLLHLRQVALQLMQDLQQFNPYITGAVWNGTAGEHSDIHLQLFSPSAKDVEIFLLNKNVNFEVGETAHFRTGQPVETLSFLLPQRGADPELAHLALYEEDDLRGSLRAAPGKRAERGDATALASLIDAPSEEQV